MNDFVKEIASAMKESKTKAYDTVAKVLRVDEKTAYVHIDGGADETPAQMAINCKTGDTVKIRVSGGKAWITGNITAPPTDDSTAEVAQRAVNAVAESYGKFAGLTVENFKAVNADIERLNTKKLDVESANIKFANIDFSNIGKAAMEYFYAQSGLIKDVVVGDQKITGHLIGVTISGDLIEGNTVKAEKLVVLGEDGLYYKLNVNALGEAVASSDAKYQNGLDGSVIIAKSVTAEKVSVKDLVAFGATIGGLNITDGSLYSGVKDSINNTTQGFYVDKNGQLYLGDAEHFLRYYKAKDGTYKLAISAKSVTFGSNQNLEEAWEETKTSIESKIETVDVEYYLSTSATSLSGGSWSTTAPAWTDGKYMWMRTKITDGAGNVTYSPDENGTCIAGATGATGSSGKGIASIVEEYYQSTSATTLSGGSWSTTAPTWVDGKYIWTRSVITYTDTTVNITDGICTTGQKGETGAQGPQGVKGNGIKSTDITYQAWPNGTSIPSGTWTSTPPDTSAENPYLWTKTVITYTDGNTSTSYSVGSTIKGVDVGGRNLLKRYIGAGVATSKIDDLSIIVGSSLGDTYFYLKSWLPLTGGEIYTISCDAENVPSGASNWIFGVRDQNSLFTININKNGRCYGTGVLDNDIAANTEFLIDDYNHPYTTPPNIKLSNFKLEKGNIATDWTPAPEDVDSAVDEAARTATNFMKYEDGTGLIVGDMRGDTLSQNTLLDGIGMAVRKGNDELVRFGTGKIVIPNSLGEIQYNGNGSVVSSKDNIVVSTQQTKNSSDTNVGGKSALEMYYDSDSDVIGLALSIKKGTSYSDLYESEGRGLLMEYGIYDSSPEADVSLLGDNTRVDGTNTFVSGDEYLRLESDGEIHCQAPGLDFKLGKNNILWDADNVGYWMLSSHKFTLNQPISEQLTGAVFAWSMYDENDKAVRNFGWHMFFVPKQHVIWNDGAGIFMTNAYTGMRKYIYVNNTYIQGNDDNKATGSGNGIPLNTRGYVLRYVIGV